jgi:hypothetical protein
MEVWKDIPQYEGIYQASSHGNIRTCEGKITSNKRYGTRRWKSRILKGRGDNYTTGKRVSLWKDGQRKEWIVARLVAITFLGNPPEGFTVNHKDGNRLNNNIDNLEWLSRGDNIRHGFATGLYHCQKAVLLVRDGQQFEFRSMAECDAFLGRHKGYTSNILNKSHRIVDSMGNKYYGEVMV